MRKICVAHPVLNSVSDHLAFVAAADTRDIERLLRKVVGRQCVGYVHYSDRTSSTSEGGFLASAFGLLLRESRRTILPRPLSSG